MSVWDRVYVVGCGPGDPELLTVKAMRLLKEADVVLYTGSLLSPELKELIGSGGRPALDTHGMSEDEIVEELVRCARFGLKCVWAHDGDPTIYGGIARVLRRLREEGVKYEVVPGVSSVTASAARLGTSLTMSKDARSVIIANPEGFEEALGGSVKGKAVVALLAGSRLGEVADALIRAGAGPESPAGLVVRATWREGEVVRIVRLKDVGRVAGELGVKGCATLVYTPALHSILGLRPARPTKVYGGARR